MKLKAIIFLLLIFGNSFIYGQKIMRSSLNAFGNQMQNEGIKLSHTAGQASNHSRFYSNNETIELRQGFQQVNTNIIPVKSKGLQFTLYPNPNNGKFSVSIDKRTTGVFDYRLYDNQGRLYNSDRFLYSGVNSFNFTLPSGSYILQLKDPEGKSGIAKIIILP